MRLAKYLAHAGVASRRSAETLIAEGRVSVAEEVVTDPARDVGEDSRVAVDGRVLEGPEPRVVYAVNKPVGVVSTASDTHGRRTVVELVDAGGLRLYPVGRLDADSSGLILLTNDGELAHRLAHPRYGVLKTYLAEVPGPLPRDLGRRLTTGVDLDDGVAIVDRFRVVEQVGSRALVEVTLHEGRKHIVRRLLAAVGHPVSRLVRTQVGPVSLGSLRPAATRQLTTSEIGDLYAAVGL